MIYLDDIFFRYFENNVVLLLYDLACFFLNQEFYELLWLSVSYIFTFLECLLVLAIILVVLLFYFCIACTFLYCIKFRSSDALISLYFFEYSYLKIIIDSASLWSGFVCIFPYDLESQIGI